MKYLTEDDLRLIYRDNPFETFTIQKQTRLTPGAKTFLMDRKVRLIDEAEKKPLTNAVKSSSITNSCLSCITQSNEWLILRSELLRVAYELIELDFSISEELCMLEQCMATPSISDRQMIKEQAISQPSVVESLGRMRLLLRTKKGRVASRLFPLYFKFQTLSERVDEPIPEVLQEVINRLASMIISCVKRCEEVDDDIKQIT
ncbi:MULTISPECIES: hypothetical protein [Streptococcus]|uniref:hypothetical protein n=1 Tax=Streptococcus TaxID=1301 RepID=UPI0012DBCF60|nr:MULTISPECIES: hypothetical protein [Streptococcus]QHF54660.1 hypothetical protein BZG42_04580 [Streptococcus sp. DAT741]